MVTIPSRRSAGHRPRAVLAATLFVTTSVSLVTAGTVASGTAAPSASSGTVSGVVFNDKNGNGAYETDAGEVGVAGSEVRAFDRLGALVGGPVTTGSDGTYELTITNADSTDLRVEFSTPTGYQPAPAGDTNGTSVQFVQVDETAVDYGVLVPENFCGDNQNTEGLSGTIVAACLYPGASTWTPGESTWEVGLPPGTPDRGTVKYTPWNASNGAVGAETTLATNTNTGAVWGLGYQRTTGLLFTSAVVRRHADLGPKGIGGLYVMRYGENGIAAEYDLATVFDAQGVEFTNDYTKWTRAARGIATPSPLDSTDPDVGLSIDTPAFDGVGKEGMGDIDVSPDGQYLWIVNLYERTLLRIALTGTRAAPALGTLTEFAIPTNVCSLTGSEERPWAVDPRPDGTVRVGLVCDNAGSQNNGTNWSLDNLAEGAFVYQLTPGTSTWAQLVSIDIAAERRYDRVCIGDPDPIGNPIPTDGRCWGAWVSAWSNYSPSLLDYLPQSASGSNIYQYGQPMLMDIENLADGSLALGFNDRTSMQLGTDNLQPVPLGEQVPAEDPDKEGYDPTNIYIRNFSMGDTVLACKQANGTWVAESFGSCEGVNTYTGVPDPDELDPDGEFFQDNLFGDHFELRQGGLATMPGAEGPSILASGTMDPCDIYQGGIYWNKVADGTNTGNCAVYTGIGNEGPSPVGFGKSTSIGDLETICDSAPIEIGNRIWVDTNSNGIQDPGEAPIAGVTLNLYDSEGNVVGTAVTNENGEYYFTSLITEGNDFDTGDWVGGGVRPFQTYTIRIDNPDDWGPGGPLDSSINSLTAADQAAASPNGSQSDAVDSDFTIVDGYPELAVAARLPGETNHTFDAGIIREVIIVAIGDYTWFDENGDGLQTAGEPPAPGVTVELYDANGDPAVDADGNPVDPVVTDANGFYLFDNLLPGDYQIRFVPPDGYEFTSQYSGGADEDSNAWVDGWTDLFTVSPDDLDTVADTDAGTLAAYVNPTIDAGFVVSDGPRLFAVGNYTWFDRNADGIQDPEERPVPGVLVELYDANGDPALDADGNPVDPVETDENGFYLFDNLLAGDYRIRFVPPEGYDFTTQYSGGSEDDSNADPTDGWTDVFTVDLGDADTIGDTDDGTVASFVNPTIDAGFVAPLVAMGDYTWYDLDGDGLQDASEDPLEGVKVQLLNPDGSIALDADGNPVPAVFTDEDGYYFIDNLLPGDYRVRFTLPNGLNYAFTQQQAGSDRADDSNPDPTTGLTPVFTIAGSVDGQTVVDTDPGTVASFVNPTIDAGVVPVVAISNYMWFDFDLDGVRDPDENPVVGGEVYLLDANGDPVTDADGNPVGPASTDENGFFRFDNLLPGEYRLLFVPPPGYAFTRRGGDDTDGADSNANPGGLTDVFRVDAQPLSATDVDDDDSTLALLSNPTVGAGLVPVVAVGNYTWIDSNRNGVQDPGELPIPGVLVELLNPDGTPALDADGNPVAAVRTDANGRYFIDNLVPGDYRIRFTPPPGYQFTVDGAGNSVNDSNPAPDSGLTPVFRIGGSVGGDTLADTNASTVALFVNPTIDAGFVPTMLPPTGASLPALLVVAASILGLGWVLTASRGRRCIG